MADSTRRTVETDWANGNPGGVSAPSQSIQDNGYGAVTPPFEEHNWLFQLMTNMLQNAEQRGIMQWRSTTEYLLKGQAMGSDGRVYQSQTASNTGNDPVLDNGTNWRPWAGQAYDEEYVALTGGTTALTQSANGTYTYDIADFVGAGIDTDEIRVVHIKATMSTSGGQVDAAAEFPDGSMHIFCTTRASGGGDNVSDSGMVAVPVNRGQLSIDVQLIDTGSGSGSFTVSGVTQRVFG